MGLMFRRDVIVLGLTDGVMCGATAMGLLLQKVILKGMAQLEPRRLDPSTCESLPFSGRFHFATAHYPCFTDLANLVFK